MATRRVLVAGVKSRNHAFTAIALVVVIIGGCSRQGGGDGPPAGWAEAEKGFGPLFAQDKAAEVVRICEQYVRDYPDFPDAHVNLAHALESVAGDLRRSGNAEPAKQSFERAATHFDRYHALVSGDKRAQASRALMFLHDETGLDDPVKAEAFARRWKEEQPDALEAHVHHAKYLRKLQRQDEASAAIRKARAVAAAELSGDEQMRASLRAAWAATVAEHLQESPNLPPSDAREFADEVIAASDEALKVNPTFFMALDAKAKALTVLAQRPDSDPRRKAALLHEVEALQRRMRQ